MTTIFQCGHLRIESSGHVYFNERLIGHGGDLNLDALIAALGSAGLLDDPLESPLAIQIAFEFPTEPPPLSPPPDTGETLADAAARVRRNIDKGILCPCCERTARRYRRKIHSEMARGLGLLVKHDDREKPGYHNIREFIPDNAKATKASSDLAYLVLWDAVARKPREPGVYKARPLGIAWVKGEITLPRIAWVYGGRATHFSKERISYKEALDEPFDLFDMLDDDEGPDGR